MRVISNTVLKTLKWKDNTYSAIEMCLSLSQQLLKL